jgi:Zn-dependent M28 family amino/carboxypeptidase
MLHLVQELEGKPDERRLQIIQKKLAEWQVPYHLQHYRTGSNLIVKATTDHFIGIGSHYDAVPLCPGANDNASAIAVTLELIKRAKGHPMENISLQFFFFDEEEYGLKGSRAYVEEFGCRGMQGLFNLELVGMGNQLALWPLTSQSKGILLETLESECQRIQVSTGRYDQILMHTADHVNFRKAGLTDAFTLTCISDKDVEVAYHYQNAQEFSVDTQTLREILAGAPLFQHYHQPTDTSEHLQESALQMTADVLWNSFLALEKG